MVKPPQRAFQTLNAARGIAAILIVIRHSWFFWGAIDFQESYLAVDLFFLISGVVLASAYDERLHGVLGTLEFLKIRLVRLYPLYVLGLILGIAVTVLRSGNSIPDLGMSIFCGALMTPTLVPWHFHNAASFPLNPPSWSLYLELVVNLAFAMCHRRLRNSILILICGISATTLIVTMSVMRLGNFDHGITLFSTPFALLRVTFSFAVGVLIYRNRLKILWQSNLAFILILSMLTLVLASSPSRDLREIYDAFAVFLALPILIYAAILIEPQARLVPFATTLGLISYPIYVIHEPFAIVFATLFAEVNAHRAPLSGILFLGGLLFISYWLEKRYDQPVRAMLVRLLPSRNALSRQ